LTLNRRGPADLLAGMRSFRRSNRSLGASFAGESLVGSGGNKVCVPRIPREVLSLPIFPELAEEEIETVSKAVVEFMERVKS